MSRILPTAGPFFLPGGKTGCLLIHGFTGTPKEMRLMGEYLSQHGFSVLGIRLAGHATEPKDMIRSRRTDWAASVEDGYQLLRGVADNIYLVGLSMGGVLSLLMSTQLDVKGVVAMSTPYRLPVDLPAWAFKLFSIFLPYRIKSKEPPGSGWFDKQAFQEQISYPQNPMRSIAELSLLLGEMRRALPLVKAPVLLIHSKDDTYVLPENMELIHAALANARVRKKLYVTGSGHVVTRDAAREQVFESVREFIQSLEANR